VVTYVLHQEDNLSETDGSGLGYLFVVRADCCDVLSNSWLNAPWSVAVTARSYNYCCCSSEFT
jgi:hypothetical protein